MYFESKTNQIKIYYEEYPGEKETLIFLHGWGLNCGEFKDLIQSLNEYHTYTLDLPGFGKSEILKSEALDLNDYVMILKEFFEQKKINNPTIVGHSFGGRIAILYNYLFSSQKMILIGSAGIKPKRTLKYYLSIYKYKVLKLMKKCNLNKFLPNFPDISNYGSEDYKILSSQMKQTFSKVVNHDLKKYLPKIQTKTLIMHGACDETVKYSDAEVMSDLIVNSKLICFYKSGHFLYKSEKDKCVKQIRRFINE